MPRTKKTAPVLDPLEAMLARLKLTGIRDQLDTLLDEAARANLSARETLGLLCEREIAMKDHRRIEMALKLAHFPVARDLASFDFEAQPSVDPKQIRDLAAAAGSPTARTCCCSARRAWARRISDRARPRGDPRRLRGAVRHGDDAGGLTRQGARREAPRGPAAQPRQAETADRRRARLSAARARCRASVVPARVAALREECDAHYVEPQHQRVGHVVRGAVVATAIPDRLLHHSHVITIRGDSYRLRAKRRSGQKAAAPEPIGEVTP
jgi:hypothetical protein